jgi:hypothetical protein
MISTNAFFGGAIYVYQENLQISHTHFSFNQIVLTVTHSCTGGSTSAQYFLDGGAAYLNVLDSILIEESSFSDSLLVGTISGETVSPPQMVMNGGAVYLETYPNAKANLFAECQFSRNTLISPDQAYGPALALTFFHPIALIGCGSQKNYILAGSGKASSAYGAVSAFGMGANGQLSVKRCWFLQNQAVGQNATSGIPAGNGLGGALSMQLGGSLVISESFFVEHQAIGGSSEYASSGIFGQSSGGAVYVNSVSMVTISGCLFDPNLALGGSVTSLDLSTLNPAGSVYGGASFLGSSNIVISDTAFWNNIARAKDGNFPGLSVGGALVIQQPTASITGSISNCTFSGNVASGGQGAIVGGIADGGAIGVSVASKFINLSIRKSRFSSNLAKGGDCIGHQQQQGGPGVGGALVFFFEGLFSEAQIILEDDTFWNNSAVGGQSVSGGAANGGAISMAVSSDYLKSTQPSMVILRRCVFLDNAALGGFPKYPSFTALPLRGGDAAGGAILVDSTCFIFQIEKKDVPEQ